MSPPHLIALDWGTSTMRAYLLGAGAKILETRTRDWGIQHTPGRDFAKAYRAVVGDWHDAWPTLPAIASGMIGSRQGWREVAYFQCPADAHALAGALLPIETPCGVLHLVPGVKQGGEHPNVLRGEETQVFGALALAPELQDESLLVLPGTHSKWVSVLHGQMQSFSTFMTGELFALLRDHSILGRPAMEAGIEASAQAFARGLDTARSSEAQGVAGRLFSTRSLVLCEQLLPAHSLDYLSGLLIGEELRSAIAGFGDRPVPALVLLGDSALCERYQTALAAFGIEGSRAIDNAGVSGLWRLAELAALLNGKELHLA